MPLFAKAGCNSGACHGSASGQEGFKVSLRGYDPGVDYVTLTRGTNGRRMNRDEPEQSLLLLKPTGQVPHEGGQRFARDSAYAKTLVRWIKEGAAPTWTTAPKLVGLDVLPSFRTFAEPRPAAAIARPRSLQRRQRARCHRRCPLQQQQRERRPRSAKTASCRCRPRAKPPSWSATARSVAVSHLVVLHHDPHFVWTNPPEINYIDKHVFAKLRLEDSAVGTVHRRRIPAPRVSRRDRPAADAGGGAGLPRRQAARQTRPPVIDDLAGTARNTPSSGRQKWADLFRLRFDMLRRQGNVGLTTAGCATAWRATSPMTSSCARSSPPRAARARTHRPTSIASSPRPTRPPRRRRRFSSAFARCVPSATIIRSRNGCRKTITACPRSSRRRPASPAASATT